MGGTLKRRGKEAVMIEMNCPHCGHLLRIPDQYAGQKGGCKHCKGLFQVPMAGGPSGVPYGIKIRLPAIPGGRSPSAASPTGP